MKITENNQNILRVEKLSSRELEVTLNINIDLQKYIYVCSYRNLKINHFKCIKNKY